MPCSGGWSIPTSTAVENKLAKRYGHEAVAAAPSPADLPQRAHITKRDLREINVYGKKLLTAEEIAAIEDITGDLLPTVKAACLSQTHLQRTAAIHCSDHADVASRPTKPTP